MIVLATYPTKEGVPNVCKQSAVWAITEDGHWPLAYLQRPKWIKSDEAWGKIVGGIRVYLPKDADIS